MQLPDNRKQTAAKKSGTSRQQQAKPTKQPDERPIDTMQMREEISMKLQKLETDDLQAAPKLSSYSQNTL